MLYNDWYSKLKKIIDFRSKNYTVSDDEAEIIIDMVYREIISYTNLTHLYEKVPPRYNALNNNNLEYHLGCEDNLHLPERYDKAQRLEVVDAVCLSGENYMKYLSPFNRHLYVLNDNAVLSEDYGYHGCVDDRLGNELIFTWKCVPEKEVCIEWVLEEIYVAMIEGINYQIISTIPVKINAELANLQYSRFNAEKTRLFNMHPVVPMKNVTKMQWNIECAPVGEDLCGCIDPCSQLVTSDGLNVITSNGLNMNASCGVHGACVNEDTDTDCCNFIPLGSTRLVTSFGNIVHSSCSYHGQCGQSSEYLCGALVPSGSTGMVDSSFNSIYVSGDHGSCGNSIDLCNKFIPKDSTGLADSENKTVYASGAHGSCVGYTTPIPPVIEPSINRLLTVSNAVVIDTNGYRILIL